jgi:hypothetical protein
MLIDHDSLERINEKKLQPLRVSRVTVGSFNWLYASMATVHQQQNLFAFVSLIHFSPKFKSVGSFQFFKTLKILKKLNLNLNFIGINVKKNFKIKTKISRFKNIFFDQ